MVQFAHYKILCNLLISQFRTQLQWNHPLINNSAVYTEGGAIYALDYAARNFNGTTNFIKNSADGNGGAICTSDNTVLSFMGNNYFSSNSAYYIVCGPGGELLVTNDLHAVVLCYPQDNCM